MTQSINKTATKGETKDAVTGWFVTRPETGEVLHHIHVTTSTNAATFAGFAWRGVFAYQWTKTGDKVVPFFQKSGAVKLAKAFELLTGERVAVVKRSVA